jgi:hypothetical protein
VTDVQVLLHMPLPEQTYGVQSVLLPCPSITVCPSAAHVSCALETHLPSTHAYSLAQSLVLTHVELHFSVPSHA